MPAPTFEWSKKRLAAVHALRAVETPGKAIARALGCSMHDLEKQFPRTKFATDPPPLQLKRMPQGELRVAETMAAYGVPRSVIAKVLRTGVDRLEREAGARMEMAVARTNSRVAGALFDEAMKGSVQAQIYWLKTRGGPLWKDTQHVEIHGKVGVLVAPGKVAPDDWIAMEEQRTEALDAQQRSMDPGDAAGAKQAVVDSVSNAIESGNAEAPWNSTGMLTPSVTPSFEPADLSDLGLPRTLTEEDEGGAGGVDGPSAPLEGRRRHHRSEGATPGDDGGLDDAELQAELDRLMGEESGQQMGEQEARAALAELL